MVKLCVDVEHGRDLSCYYPFSWQFAEIYDRYFCSLCSTVTSNVGVSLNRRSRGIWDGSPNYAEAEQAGFDLIDGQPTNRDRR